MVSLFGFPVFLSDSGVCLWIMGSAFWAFLFPWFLLFLTFGFGISLWDFSSFCFHVIYVDFVFRIPFGSLGFTLYFLCTLVFLLCEVIITHYFFFSSRNVV